ncbi:precorrin-8X methylmutase [uncultured Methanofollis sp.]|uniref:precorrin-8X methylmutase n=1 Tax=uncultured Methanofollis sp. TaxID=262500 RepID=UPI0026213742|nr:precorrin-8X methylmutase [uncultured Methanofollis sp.]
MYIDPGADTPEGYTISKTSRALARQVVGDRTPEDRIRQRCAISVGDFVMADLVRIKGDSISAGLSALAKGAPIITDIHMVQMGIRKKEHSSEVLCALDFGGEISAERGITRSSAGLIALRDRLEGAIVVIGNAPSSLLSLCSMVREEGVRPALVIGMAVGFVNAAESKEVLRTLDIPSISTQGTRGGTPPAVAAMNEIITMYVERTRGE